MDHRHRPRRGRGHHCRRPQGVPLSHPHVRSDCGRHPHLRRQPSGGLRRRSEGLQTGSVVPQLCRLRLLGSPQRLCVGLGLNKPGNQVKRTDCGGRTSPVGNALYRDYYFEKLDKHFKGLKEKYIKYYGERYNCAVPNYKSLYKVFTNECDKYGILYNMKDIIKAYKKEIKDNEQISLF